MDLREAEEIIAAEGLEVYACFGVPRNQPDVVAVFPAPDGWHVVNTDERAVPGAERVLASESEALTLFVRRLRLSKRLDTAASGS